MNRDKQYKKVEKINNFNVGRFELLECIIQVIHSYRECLGFGIKHQTFTYRIFK